MQVTLKHYKTTGGSYTKISEFTLVSQDRQKASQLWVGERLIGEIEEDGLPAFLKLFDSLIVSN